MKGKKQTNTSKTQLVVPSPRWLQKRMLKNLQSAARSKIKKGRVQKAAEILKIITEKAKLADSQTKNINRKGNKS